MINIKNIIKVLVASLFLMTALVGCIDQQCSEELKDKIIERCTPLAESWIKNNISDVTDVTVELFELNPVEVCYDVVVGKYTKDDKEYFYHLNVDTEEFVSDEYYQILYNGMESILSDTLTFDYEFLYFHLDGSEIHGKVVSDQNNNQKRDELKTHEITRNCGDSYKWFDIDKLTDIAHEKLSEKSFDINVQVENAENILADTSLLSFLKEHKNWELVLKDNPRPELDYRIYYKDGQYQVFQAFLDDKGQIQYKSYVLDDKSQL